MKAVNPVTVLVSLILAQFLLFSCDFGLPSFGKDLAVDGHTQPKLGAMHAENLEHPFKGQEKDKGCATSNCHQTDLQGGFTDKSKLYAPSCFQCHGKLWKDKP